MIRRRHALALALFATCAFASPLGGRAVERACAADDVHIAVVVDIGTGNSVSAVCVAASAMSNGASILAARASMLGVPQPRYSASGLLCSIDGVPATGCGEHHDGKYAYWSYWHGIGGNWSYANIGPGGSRVDTSVVEGWRWQPNGAGLPTDPPPRGPATAAAVCVPSAPSTTAVPPTTGHTAPPTTTGNSPTTTLGEQGSTPPTGPGSRTPPSSVAAVAPTPTTARSSTKTNKRHHSSTGPYASVSPAPIVLTHGGIGGAPVGHTSGGPPVGLAVGIGFVVALGAGGAVAARRRSRTNN